MGYSLPEYARQRLRFRFYFSSPFFCFCTANNRWQHLFLFANYYNRSKNILISGTRQYMPGGPMNGETNNNCQFDKIIWCCSQYGARFIFIFHIFYILSSVLAGRHVWCALIDFVECCWNACTSGCCAKEAEVDGIFAVCVRLSYMRCGRRAGFFVRDKTDWTRAWAVPQHWTLKMHW